MADQHGTQLNPLSRTVTHRWDTRFQPDAPTAEEIMAQRREAKRRYNLRRYWYAEYERNEWWRQFRLGMIYTWLPMATVFAFGLLIGYFAHARTHHHG